MDLPCDICFNKFDLDERQPKSLPCGHTICKECVTNPALGGKCPTCRKDLTVDPSTLPNTIYLIQLMQHEIKPLQEIPKSDGTPLKELQSAVDAGRELVQQMRQMATLAIEGLYRLQESSEAKLKRVEEAVAELQAAAAVGDGAQPVVAEDVLQAASQLEEGLRLLRKSECSVVAEQAAGGARWAASSPLGPTARHLCSLLLLQLQATGELEAGGGVHPAARAPFVGPPVTTTLTILEEDLVEGRLKVNDILRNEQRWINARSVRELRGTGCEDLLRVLAPQLEELVFADGAKPGPSVMEVVRDMKSLRILSVVQSERTSELAYPDLPLQLEELIVFYPRENQLRCVQHMSGLRSLELANYSGPEVVFPPSARGGLLWLSVALNRSHNTTMLSLIRANAPSLQYLQVYCEAEWDPVEDHFFFPDLAESLAASGLVALRRLVLERAGFECAKSSACLLQLRALRALLPAAVAVSCKNCSGPAAV